MKHIFLFVLFILTLFSSAISMKIKDKTLIYGKVLGYKDQPIQLAYVTIMPDAVLFGHLEPIKVEKNGSYKILTKLKGIITLNFTGDKHARKSVVVFIENTSKIKLDVRLIPYEWEKDKKEIKLIGDFNDFSSDSGYILMKKQNEGKFTASLDIQEDGVMGYGIMDYTKKNESLISGTEGKVELRDKTGFISKIYVKKGKRIIEFDPAKLPVEKSEFSFKFQKSDSVISKIALIAQEMDNILQRYDLFLQENQEKGITRFNWNEIVNHIKDNLRIEENKFVRQMLLISYINLINTGLIPDSSFIKEALSEIPPDSPLFHAMFGHNLYEAILINGGYDKNKKYFEDIIEKNRGKEFKSILLESAFENELKNGNSESARQFYKRLQNDYSESFAAKIAKLKMPCEKIIVGKPMIPFEFICIDSSGTTYTDKYFKGKNYLIDFWAVWCTSCCAELPNIHKIYEKYKNSNFDILSVSFDSKPGDVEKYRKKKWAMPWHHAFIGKDEFKIGSKISEMYEIYSIPKPILVNSEGIVVAVGEDLLGEKLNEHLIKLLSK
jgi:thiol-disulfide isomerase/thioredoxin